MLTKKNKKEKKEGQLQRSKNGDGRWGNQQLMK